MAEIHAATEKRSHVRCKNVFADATRKCLGGLLYDASQEIPEISGEGCATVSHSFAEFHSCTVVMKSTLSHTSRAWFQFRTLLAWGMFKEKVSRIF